MASNRRQKPRKLRATRDRGNVRRGESRHAVKSDVALDDHYSDTEDISDLRISSSDEDIENAREFDPYADRGALRDSIQIRSAEIKRLLLKYHPFDILTHIALAELPFAGLGIYRHSDQEPLAAALEYAAQLCRQLDCNLFAGNRNVDPMDVHNLSELLHGTLTEAMHYHFSESPQESSSDAPIDVSYLRMSTLVDNTIVRVHAYPQHMRAVLTGVFSSTEEQLTTALGFGLQDAMTLDEMSAKQFVDAVNDRISMARDDNKAVLDSVSELKKGKSVQLDEEIEPLVAELASLSGVALANATASLVIGNALFALGDACSFSPCDLAQMAGIPIERVQAYLDCFSIELGDQGQPDSMPAATNDFTTRPFLRLQGRYLRVAHSPYAAIKTRLEHLLNPGKNESKNQSSRVWERYCAKRAAYAESAAVKCFRQMLPTATIEPNVKYIVVEDNATKTAELDALIQFDTTLILVEVKAGAFDQASRRGAPVKLLRDATALVGNANDQAARAERFIDGSDTPVFSRSDGTALTLDKRTVKRVFRVCVSLDHMDTVLTHLHRLKKVGVVPSTHGTWAVALFDLMVIAEMIEYPTQLVHYLLRRQRVEEIGCVETHDELDLFGNYLADGLYFEEMLDKSPSLIWITSHSAQFDDWYYFQEGIRVTPVPKPGMKIDPALRGLIDELALSERPGYSEAILQLLELSGDAQRELLRMFDETRKLTRTDGLGHISSCTLNGGKRGLTIATCKEHEARILKAQLGRFVNDKMEANNSSQWLGLLSVVGRRGVVHHWEVRA